MQDSVYITIIDMAWEPATRSVQSVLDLDHLLCALGCQYQRHFDAVVATDKMSIGDNDKTRRFVTRFVFENTNA